MILLGAPGAGKGTQAEKICQKFEIPSISTGAMLREAIKQDTALGKQVKNYLDSGGLVPDELMIALIEERIAQPDCNRGFILDGFPRTIPQAEAMDDMGLCLDVVLSIEVTDQQILERISERRMCENCGATFHLRYNPTAVEGICDKCGGKTIQRLDDQPKAVETRLAVFHQQTEPLKAYYQEKGNLKVIAGHKTVADTTALVMEALTLFV